MDTYPTTFSAGFRPLAVIQEGTDSNENGFVVADGLTLHLAGQLIENARQPYIVRMCPADAQSRFKDIESVASWQSKGRLVLPLVLMAEEAPVSLAGIAWMGPGKPKTPVPGKEDLKITFAIRIFEQAAGRGLALPYTNTVLRAHAGRFGNQGVWLEAWKNNVPAIRTYGKAGFRKIAEVDDTFNNESATRIYMELGNVALRE